jgi:hypothetical protein
MASRPEETPEEVPDALNEEPVAAPEEESTPEGEEPVAAPADGADAGTDDGPAFGFEGEITEDRPDDSRVIREMRARMRDKDRENHELRQQLGGVKPADEIGPKPSLESCGYDEEQHERELLDWGARRSAVEAKAQAEAETQRKSQEAWASRVAAFDEKARAVMPNYAEQAQALVERFGDDANGAAARAAIVFADDPRLIAALNNSPAKLEELLALKDQPLALAVRIGELKGKIATMPKRSTPGPETIARGGAPSPGGIDARLEKLEKEADRTGDRSAVIAYKREKREAAANAGNGAGNGRA